MPVPEITHTYDPETLSLTSESSTEDGRGAGTLRVSWKTEEEAAAHVEAAIISANEYLTNLARHVQEEVYAGAAAEGATNRIRRIDLPFGLYLGVGRLDGQEYDEGALVLGGLKFTVPLKLTGGAYWLRTRTEWRPEEMWMFGYGGAKTARFVKFGRRYR